MTSFTFHLQPKKEKKDLTRSTPASCAVPQSLKEELREWIPLNAVTYNFYEYANLSKLLTL